MPPMKSKRYFDWLVQLVDGVSEMPDVSYTMLLKILHSHPFWSTIPNDDNRAEDGLELRKIFSMKYGGPMDEDTSPCSVLEMLIALARRMAYMLSDEHTDEDSTIPDFFWIFIRNLGLEEYTDEVLIGGDEPGEAECVDSIVERLVERTYMSDGWGGIFPLRNPPGDQRTTEIWYQMQAYMIENFE